METTNILLVIILFWLILSHEVVLEALTQLAKWILLGIQIAVKKIISFISYVYNNQKRGF